MKTRGIKLLAVALLATVLPFHATAADGYPAPPLDTEQWINSEPLGMKQLQGRVVLVEFWTFGCWNCRNVEPHIKAWYARYRDQGLMVIGVHAPEFPYERDPDRLRSYLGDNGIDYPIAVDNDFTVWRDWHNRAWPTIYLIDKQGQVRYRRIGEGAYGQTEETIRRLLLE